jgi:hypothetical protein
MMLEENLVGYVLNALEPELQRDLEIYLREHPDAQQQVEAIRQALEPLKADAEHPEPPPGLRIRTLARIAEYRCQELPHRRPAVIAPPPPRAAVLSMSWWRRADVLVAASLLLLMIPLGFSGIAYLHHRSAITLCQDNLRRMFLVLSGYSDMHNGEMPKVAGTPPFNFAGVYAAIMRDRYPNGPDFSTGCPANGSHPPATITLQQLDELYGVNPAEFARLQAQLGGCYAYTLGYRNPDGQLCGLRRIPGQENDRLPILADKPPFDRPEAINLDGNSPNHGGFGQNVLFMGGNVDYFTRRQVGPNGDDIYLNIDHSLEAGLSRIDSVLGASRVHPLPGD